MKEVTLNDILFTIGKWRIEANSPYNDGWTSNAYRDQLKEIEEELEKGERPFAAPPQKQ